MIDVQEAVRTAVKYCAELFPGVVRVRLEEVERTDDDKHWLITIGFDEPVLPREGLAYGLIESLVPRDAQRQYRVVHINAESGEVRAVKIRQPLERVP